jgi:hypothetical protein
MRDDLMFTKSPALGSIGPFPLCRYEIENQTTKLPSLWQSFHIRSSKRGSPKILFGPGVPAREQIRQPAKVDTQSR